MDDKKIKLLNYILLGFSIFTTFGLLVYAGGGINSMLTLLALWPLVPFLVLVVTTYRATLRKTLVTTTILSFLHTLSIYLYFDSLFVHLDAQGALIFLFLPLCQMFTIVLGFSILGIVNFVNNKK
jgi:hypothetical protein